MIFEMATRMKLRFETEKGVLSAEDIWDLPLTSANGVSLDGMARQYNRKLKEGREESFVERPKPDPMMAETELRFELIKRVIEVRLNERDRAKKAKERKERKEKILAIMAEKQDESLKKASMSKLQKMLDELDD
ncbi:MAG: hypothetical protein AMS21_01145 [Gemmatimonas sp. SG8_38_2]|nr:MAG: hypothetical protein AMS21_01145 [Gemmatimonas sp. SG8_38_2]